MRGQQFYRTVSLNILLPSGYQQKNPENDLPTPTHKFKKKKKKKDIMLPLSKSLYNLTQKRAQP